MRRFALFENAINFQLYNEEINDLLDSTRETTEKVIFLNLFHVLLFLFYLNICYLDSMCC